MTEIDVFNATLVDRRDFTDELSIVRIRPDSGQVPDFAPGQFIKLGLPREELPEFQMVGERPMSRELNAPELEACSPSRRARSGPRLVRRAYSIASSPLDREYLELLVVRVQTGKLTPRLWQIEPGGRLWMEDKATGHFTLDPIPPGKDVVMISTGTGIAPFISMLRAHRHAPPWRRVIVINGVRYAADLAYRDELEAWAGLDRRVRYVPIVSRESRSSAWTGLRGRVQQMLEPAVYESLVGAALHPQECHVMLCGNPEMITSVQHLLEEAGFHTHSASQPGNIHFERYW